MLLSLSHRERIVECPFDSDPSTLITTRFISASETSLLNVPLQVALTIQKKSVAVVRPGIYISGKMETNENNSFTHNLTSPPFIAKLVPCERMKSRD